MTTFGAILLAFPLYLAVNGRLPVYVDLAKPATPAGAAVNAASNTAAGVGMAQKIAAFISGGAL